MAELVYRELTLKRDSELAAKRRFRARLTSREVDRHGDLVEPDGVDLAPWLKTGGPVLGNHDTSRPVARVIPESIERTPDFIDATFAFPPKGVSADADEKLGLIQAGVVGAVSIGFIPGDTEPLEKGSHFLTSELVEVSVVAVPANPGAVVLAKSHQKEEPAMPEPSPEVTKTSKTPEPTTPTETILPPPVKAPAVVTSKNAAPQSYNLLKTIAEAMDGKLTGIEAETHDEITSHTSKSYKGAAVPWSALFGGVTKAGSTAPGSGGELSPLEYRPGDLFKTPAALRAATAAGRLGAQFISTQRESVEIPKITAGTAAGWVAKDATATAAGDLGTGSVTLTPKYLSGTTQVNRSAIRYTEPSLVSLVTQDLRESVASALDSGLLFGDGTSNAPLGWFDSTQGYNAAAITGDIVLADIQGAKRRLIEAWKADDTDPRFRWFMSPALRDKLRFLDTAPAAKTGAFVPLLSGSLNASGDIPMLGMGSVGSAQVPITSGTPDTTDLYAVKVDELVAVLFGALDMISDPYTLSTSGAVQVSVFQDVNCTLRAAAAIEALTGADL